ncbi:MAG TPA: GNAT family N-acetyltransferase, partial [Candidatus Acidoferrales bacterium]|nr:GNAT family N-acetyltransferase [Candidatus Acidoferrales bacterium]
VISDDRTRLDIALIHAFLSERSYWAQGVPIEIVERSIQNSLCFGMFKAGRQIGFARVVTDFTTFAWLADVFIVEEVRGGGFGKNLWLLLSDIRSFSNCGGSCLEHGTRTSSTNDLASRPSNFPNVLWNSGR